jgi:hypothetical protein
MILSDVLKIVVNLVLFYNKTSFCLHRIAKNGIFADYYLGLTV